MVDETLAGSGHELGPAAGRPAGGEALLPATLIDRYQVERRLGTGGMGVVYAARDIHLGRSVAIKVVGEWIDSASGQDRLVREAQAMAKLRHPNLATVFDIGVSEGRLFVAMELVDGGTLADWLKRAPRTWREVLAAYLQAARGLAAAHAAGFVHRDFKPENVLMGTDGVARVSDFGLARLLGETGSVGPHREETGPPADARTAGVVGTPGYIAPELLRHQGVDGRADQFSFCVALYAALYGQRPFAPLPGPGQLTETLGPLRPTPSGVGPRWLARLVTRGLAADPGARWPTMDALIAAVQRRQGLGRRRAVLVAAGLTLAAALGLAALLREPPAPRPDWAPVVIGRERPDAPLAMAVSADGSTLVSYASTEAWVEPREGGGPRHRVAFPALGRVVQCRLSRTGDQLVCNFDRGPAGFEIWALDVATGRGRRRVPPEAGPTLKPGKPFDVGPDGRVLFGLADLSAVWSVDPAGALERVLTAQPGEVLVGWVWSRAGDRIAYKVRIPGGGRIEVLDTRTHRRAVVSHRLCQDLEWLTDRSLACVPRAFRSPVVVELLLPEGDGEATERLRHAGPEYQQVSGLSASSAGVLLSTSPNDQHLALLDLDPVGDVRRVASGGVTDLPPAGWTSAGALLFGANVQGHLRLMARWPDGRLETLPGGPAAEVPLAVLGEAIVFGRFPGGEATIPFFETPFGRKYPDGELFRVARAGAAARSLGPTRGFTALLCASGAAPPCLLAERAGGEVEAIDFDPATGARGRLRARWVPYIYASVGALAPDGRTLAQVHRVLGYSELSLLDLERGTRRPVLAPGVSLDFPRFQPDGALLAMAASADRKGIVRVRDPGPLEWLASLPAPEGPSSAAEEFQVASDGKVAALLLTDPLRTHWWVPLPPD